MAFGQANTGFQVGIANKPFSTGFSSGFSTPFTSNSGYTASKTTQKKDGYTYNSRYPGFDEEDYKRLEKMVADKGITGSEKTKVMDELYQIYYPQVLNKHKLDERQVEINNSIYNNGELLLSGDKEANMGTKLTSLSQSAKQKFGIPYNVNDEEVINAMVNGIPDGNKLLYEYVNNGNPELLYQAGLEERPQQGGVKNLINQAGDNGKSWDEKNLREKGETVTNYTNLVGLGTEKIDEAAGKFADKWLDWGNTAVESSSENLKNKINSMSKEEVERYRKQYEQLLKDKDWRVGRVQGDTLVEQLWNGIKGDISYDYNDDDFMEWLISQKANLREDISGADELLKGESDPNVIQFFGNIPSSALKTFTATVRGMTNPYDTMKGLYKLAATEEGHQALLNRYGSWDAFANAMNTDPVGVADDVLAVAELGTNIAKGGLKFTGKVTGNQSLANMGNSIPTIGSANDALAQKTVGGVYGIMDNAAKLTNNSTVSKINNILQTESSLAKMNEVRKDTWQAVKDSDFGQMVKNAADEAINKIVGIDEADRELIRENKDLVNDNLKNKKNADTILDEVKEKVSEKRLQNSEMGQEYETLRKNKSKVVDTTGITNDMKKTLKKNGISIDKDGNLKFNDMSKFNPKQQSALIDAWNELKKIEKAKNINAGNVLDMRQKFDDKLNWDGKAMDLNGNLSAVDKATESLIKDMRGVIDTRAKGSVVGLAELDAKYADALAEMQQIKKDWLNPDGTFRDNARSKIRNLTKAGNEEKLARLEQLIPGISNDLKALDVALTVERASKQGVGQYSKGILGGSIPAGIVNPVAGGVGVVLWILSSPKNYVKLIEVYPDIAEKLSAGQELLPSDMTKLQSLATRLQDGMEE